jgi:protein AIR1/2
MSFAAENEANDSRTTSVGVKRLLPWKLDKSSQPTTKKPWKKRKTPKASQQDLEEFARPTGERYGFDSKEYRDFFNRCKGGLARAKQLARSQKRLLAKEIEQDLAGDEPQQSTITDSSPPQDRSGAMAWNNGTAGKIRTSLRANVPETESELGNNRLATGFIAPAAAAPSPDSLESGETHSTPIEISSDEEESEGGMEINVDGQATPEIVNLDSDEDDEDSDEDMEDGARHEQAFASKYTSSPTFGDPDTHKQLQGELERHISNDFEPLSLTKKYTVRLADLSVEELEQQYKYCFYGLARDQIDLSRPVICVECLDEGHTDTSCPEKHCTRCVNENDHARRQCPIIRRCTKCRERGHDAESCESKLKASVLCERCGSTHHVESECTLRFFPPVKPTTTASIKLWISCCACASKTHLVGDCPSLHPDEAPAWSLRTLDPQQISNMSLQTGITGLEKAAENRGMRPQGRDIRPAKRRPVANQRKTFDDDPDENFIRPPVPRRNQQRSNINFAPPPPPGRETYPHDRYDPYDAPSAPDNRSRGAYYATDSFGQRRRSRSPDRRRDYDAGERDHDYGGGDSYRPYDQPPPQRRSAAMLPPGPSRYPRDGRYDESPPPGNYSYQSQPPLPLGPPPGRGSSYRPGSGAGAGAGLPAKPPQGRGQRGGYR